MNKKNIFIIISAIIFIILVLVLIGYLTSKKKTLKTGINETEKKITPAPLLITTSPEERKISESTPTSMLIEKSEKYQLIFDKQVFYIGLDYPLLYIYEPQDGLIKYLNLEDETYKEIAKVYNIVSLDLSPDKQKIIFKINNEFYLLNIKKDIISRLPIFTKSYAFTLDKIIVYLSDYKNFSYLDLIDENNKRIKIRDLGLLNPEIVFSPPDKIFLYNNEGATPVFLINLKKPSIMNLFLEAKENYSILPNKNGDLIFISSEEGSKIINLKKETLIDFSWQTTKEKCSFEDILICAVSENFSYNDWKLFGFNIDNKIIIYEPIKKETKEINLDKMFDIVNPKLTPKGIIFSNRLDGKIYLLRYDFNF